MSAQSSPFPPINQRGSKVVTTDEDYTLENLDRTVIATKRADDNNPDAATVLTLPPSPLQGQSHRLVAAEQAISVNGNGNNVAGQAAILVGRAVVFTFAHSTMDPCGPGVWVPDCCEPLIPG